MGGKSDTYDKNAERSVQAHPFTYDSDNFKEKLNYKGGKKDFIKPINDYNILDIAPMNAERCCFASTCFEFNYVYVFGGV
jgi:hypothetical protein